MNEAEFHDRILRREHAEFSDVVTRSLKFIAMNGDRDLIVNIATSPAHEPHRTLWLEAFANEPVMTRTLEVAFTARPAPPALVKCPLCGSPP